MSCCNAILGVLIPPVLVGLEKGCGADLCINIILTFFLIYIGGIIHAFSVMKVECCTNVLCILLPPFGACRAAGCTEFCICLILSLLGGFPGVIYAYYVAMKPKVK